MKRIIIPIIATAAILIGVSAQAQTGKEIEKKEDTLKVEKKENKTQIKPNTSKTTTLINVNDPNKDKDQNQEKITITEDGVKADKRRSKKNQSTGTTTNTDNTSKKGAEKKTDAELNELKSLQKTE